jgi:para-nitrobenzyl esterase
VPAASERLTTVSAFVAPARMLAKSMQGKSSKAYLYQFTRVPPNLAENRRGAFHSLEILYVFGPRGMRGVRQADLDLSAAMQGCWVRFARTGNPNGPGVPKWPAYDAATDSYMEFGDAIAVKTGLYKEACDVLEKVLAERRAAASQPATTPAPRP